MSRGAVARRQGQIQTMEPIIITVFLAIIIGVVLLFYLRISSADGARTDAAQEDVQDLAALKRLARMPEIACPRSETGQTYCIDLYKARSLGTLTADDAMRTRYYPLFGSSRINITVIDVSGGGAQEPVTVYDTLNGAKRVRTTIMYTTVYDPSEDPRVGTRKFAIVTIERMST